MQVTIASLRAGIEEGGAEASAAGVARPKGAQPKSDSIYAATCG